MRNTLALALVLALAPALAQADVIHLADGTTREGRIVEANDKEVVVDFGHGSISLVTRIPRAEVVRIERKVSRQETLMTGYVARLARAAQGNADDWYALGVWCHQQRCLNDKALEALQRALALDPNHAGARAALGHVKLNAAWMTRQQAVAMLAPGFVDGTEAKAGELAAKKQAEEARTRFLAAEKRLEELKTRITELEKLTAVLRQRLAVAALPPPPPPRPRVIYQPIYVIRGRDHSNPHRPRPKAGTVRTVFPNSVIKRSK